jgi:hypothetical protein
MCIKDLHNSELPVRIMPRDVSTRWNSTCDMLSFSIKYKAAIAKLTSEHKDNLGKYELAEEEWKIAEELAEMLKVTTAHLCFLISRCILHSSDFQRWHGVLLPWNTEPGHCHPCHGPH